MKIAIIGHGFVGKAVEYGFSSPFVEKKIIDPKYGSESDKIDDLKIWSPDLTFICVPTPMQDDGDIDTSILDDVIEKIDGMSGIIAIKSTVTPSIIGKYDEVNIVYNPEFLTERSACEQFVNPEFHIFGGHIEICKKLKSYYETHSLCNHCPSYILSKEEASFVKYAINSFLATKVVFFNQLYDACNTHDNVNFNEVIKAVGADKRINVSHTKVPGFDGKKGFGGACFPKDTSAFVRFTDKMSLLSKVIEINDVYRSQYERDAREKEQNIKFKNHEETE